jgi:PAS domain S-box-containing protein
MRQESDLEQKGYRILLENIREYGIFMLDPDGNVRSWNAGAEQIFQYTHDEAIGRNYSMFFVAADVESRLPLMNLRTAGEIGRFETANWRLRKDGSKFRAAVVITALRDDEGKLIGYGELTRDLTIDTDTEKELSRLNIEMQSSLMKTRSEVSDYKHALDESSIVAITDQKGIIKHVNANFCRISKYSAEELLGQDHRILNSGYHPKAFIRELWTTIANGKIWRGELRNRAKDGSFYWVDTTIVPFLNEKGKPYQYLAIRSDISARKAAEEKLYKANENLENKVRERTLELTGALVREKELSDMKSQFVSTASHEFRTPLSAILSSISLIEHYADPSLADKRNRHIERVKSSVKNLTSILDDFLSLEKLEHGNVQTVSIDFNMEEFIRDVIEEVDGMARKKQQKIWLRYSGIFMVCQDRKILRNIFLNLLTNAIKYSGEQKPIEVIADVDAQITTIQVIDQGIGIPEDARANLFGRFFRARNAINIQGIGLGLHIVKRYVELIGGSIEFTTSENEGTTFIVRFPTISADNIAAASLSSVQ